MPTDPLDKMSSRLREELDRADVDGAVEVVIALALPDIPTAGTRAERIASVKEHFADDLASFSDRLSAVGGEVLDAAWINSTVRSRVPVDRIGELAADDGVLGVDFASPIEAESQPMTSQPMTSQPTTQSGD